MAACICRQPFSPKESKMHFSQKEKNYLDTIKASYGKPSSREYTEEEMNRIREDFSHVSEDFTIDDITWHDIHGDDFYKAVNHSYSSLGDRTLYQILRTPVIRDNGILNERKRVLSFLDSEEEIRTFLAYKIGTCGRQKKDSLYHILNRIKKLKSENKYRFIYHSFLLPISIAFLFVSVPFGALLILFSIIWNIYTYAKTKEKIQDEYSLVVSFTRLIRVSEELSKCDIPPLSSYLEKLKKESKKVSDLSRNHWILGDKASNRFSSGITETILDYVRMMTHIDFIKFYGMAEKIRKEEATLLSLADTLGFLETMISVSSYRKALPYFTEGNVTSSDKPYLSFTELYHPFTTNPVANSLTTEKAILLTGSNASGKSTFLRSVAVASLFAETIVTIPAKTFESSYFRLLTSMSLTDDLKRRESYFTMEIKAVRRIFDEGQKDGFVLGMIDEVLRGTNTIERIAASSAILKAFSGEKVLLFAATHDIELTELLPDFYRNFHFEESMEGGNLTFTYHLIPGPATTKNAILLLSKEGYDPAIIKSAEKMAQRFQEDGIWELI